MSFSNYVSIGDFGQTSAKDDPLANPLTYCAVSGLDSGFAHNLGLTNLLSPDSSQCQLFMGQYCARDWDGVCEYVYQDERKIPAVNTMSSCGTISGAGSLTKGDILIRNTAQEKYLVKMSGNCKRVYQPFDPTVANSPLIGTWTPQGQDCGSNCSASNQCIPVFDVDAKGIDRDPVMNRLLAKPWIALDLLKNIYNHRVKNNTLGQLKGSRLYNLLTSQVFQQAILGANMGVTGCNN